MKMFDVVFKFTPTYTGSQQVVAESEQSAREGVIAFLEGKVPGFEIVTIEDITAKNPMEPDAPKGVSVN